MHSRYSTDSGIWQPHRHCVHVLASAGICMQALRRHGRVLTCLERHNCNR